MRAAGWGLLIGWMAAPAFADVETVTVTAAPADPVGNAAFSVVRVDASDLHALDQLDRALEQIPGLSTFRRDSCLSANPTTQGVSLRSIAPSGAGRALVTLDGVPLNDPFGGWVLWCSLPPEDLDGAEVVRGAGAGPYGAGALTGTIALDEASGDGPYAADASAGALGLKRAAGSGGASVGAVELFGSAAWESMTGWVPVSAAQRGAADDDVTLDARNASLRAELAAGAGTEIFMRGGIYDEARHSGLQGATSDAEGETASVTVVHPQTADALGWRFEAWMRESGFSNSSVAIGPHRAFTTPTNDEYATPALGWGVNGELRGGTGNFNWAAGFDARAAQGETHELFGFTGGHFTMNRVAGGQTLVGGAYLEAADRFAGWLLTAGVRSDEWQSTAGQLRQNLVASGAVTLDRHFPDRRGTVPTARVGVRRDFGDVYLRAAAYEGFRAPTLNELYRPFRQGNNFTLANAGLAPEKLYGGEMGVGGAMGGISWDVTAFWNQLQDGIANVTIGRGPGVFPAPAGFIPSGGLLIERENVGDIDAYGIEADIHYAMSSNLLLTGAFDLVDAHVYGGSVAPQLDGQRPAQAPRWTVTGSAEAGPFDNLTVYVDVRYESERFADDQNSLALPAATEIDAKLSWNFWQSLSVYVAADNLLNSTIATTESADGVFNDDFPRIFRAGVEFRR